MSSVYVKGRKHYQVTIVGPSTFAAFLDSLLVGFETLQITKDASRIYNDLEKLTNKFQNHFIKKPGI